MAFGLAAGSLLCVSRRRGRSVPAGGARSLGVMPKRAEECDLGSS